MKQAELKLHWFSYAFVYGNSQASVYLGYHDKQISKPRIENAKEEAGIPKTAVLMSVCFLMQGTNAEFTEDG